MNSVVLHFAYYKIARPLSTINAFFRLSGNFVHVGEFHFHFSSFLAEIICSANVGRGEGCVILWPQAIFSSRPLGTYLIFITSSSILSLNTIWNNLSYCSHSEYSKVPSYLDTQIVMKTKKKFRNLFFFVASLSWTKGCLRVSGKKERFNQRITPANAKWFWNWAMSWYRIKWNTHKEIYMKFYNVTLRWASVWIVVVFRTWLWIWIDNRSRCSDLDFAAICLRCNLQNWKKKELIILSEWNDSSQIGIPVNMLCCDFNLQY